MMNTTEAHPIETIALQVPKSVNNRQLHTRNIPETEFFTDQYIVRFARTPDEIDAALRLRFEVFNLELKEGLDVSYITGRDQDRFDAVCHHLIVLEKKTGVVVGTYRVQTLEMTRKPNGFYCAEEFKIEDLSLKVLAKSLEIGRACIARSHRNTRVLFLLWKALANYALKIGKRYLFGCCSLTSQDPDDGRKAMQFIKQSNFFHPEILIAPHDGYRCETEMNFSENNELIEWQLPKLFLTYMRFGAKVCSSPAIDTEFKTIDFLVMFDFEAIDEKTKRLFVA